MVMVGLRPDKVRSPEIRALVESWREHLGVGPFLAVHASIPLIFGLGDVLQVAGVPKPAVVVGRSAMLFLVALYLLATYVKKHSELERLPSTARLVRSCRNIGLLTLAFAIYFALPLLQ